MIDQLQLPMRTTGPGDTADARLRELVSVLRGRGWVSSRELEARGFADRELRELVEHDEAAEVLSYPGSPGYRLFAEASLAEIERTSSLRSQARRMLRRWVRYHNRLHRGAGNPPAGRSRPA